jgi:hypothetical protein
VVVDGHRLDGEAPQAPPYVSSSDHPRWVIQGAEEPWDGRGMVAPDYVRPAGRVAYLYGWPLVNTHSRLGTRNKNLHRAADGSLTLTASATRPADGHLRASRLPARAGPFALFLRAYRPEQPILDGSWIPPTVTRLR